MYSIHDAKSNLSRLIAKAEKGEEVIIARGKTPVAKLVRIETSHKARIPGRLKDKITIPRSFFRPMADEELREWGIK